MILSSTLNEKTGQLTLVLQLSALAPSSTGKMLLAGTTGGFRPTSVMTEHGPLLVNVMTGVKQAAPALSPVVQAEPSATTPLANGPAQAGFLAAKKTR